MAGAAGQAGDTDSSRAPDLASGLQGSVGVHCDALLLVPQWRCISSFVFYISVEKQQSSTDTEDDISVTLLANLQEKQDSENRALSSHLPTQVTIVT